VAATALVAALILGAGAAMAAGPGAMTNVAQGVNPASLPGASVFGDTSPATPETVSFVMRAQDLPQLQASVLAGVTHYLSVDQFAATYGQSSAAIAGLRAYLGTFGITTQAYQDRLDVVANGTAGEFDQALAVQQHQYHVPALKGAGGRRGLPAQTVHGSPQSPELPASIARTVLAVFGLSNYQSFASQTVHTNSSVVHPQAGSASSCLALTGLPRACNTPADFASEYNLDGLYRRGAEGQGQTLAIVTFAALDPGAPQYFWKHILGLAPSARTVTVDNIDGGPGAPSDGSGSGETDLDVEQSGGLAPGANVVVYQAPNSDPGSFDALFTAASQNLASSVSMSWGESETVIASAIASGTEDPAFEAATDEAFLEMDAQGQSPFVTSGDEAAYDDYDELGTTEPAVDNPGDSPYVTTSGGTTLPFSGTVSGPDGTAPLVVPAQRIWGWDYTWRPTAQVEGVSLATVAEDPFFGVGGSGGGFSRFEAEPSYQRRVPGTSSFTAVPYFTPTDVQNVGGIFEPTAFDFDSTPRTIHGSGSGRAVPDMSADADPNSGYLLYEPSFAGINEPVLQGGWGGTSFVAPQFNGSAAVIDSFVGHRLGFWNPSIYSFATRASSPFTPLNQPGTSNDNLLFSGTPGTLFNEGAGLGYPDLSQLAGEFTSQH
jgi:kumamolisin